MSEEKLLDAFGQIEEEFIEEADPEKKRNTSKKGKRNVWVTWGATAACAVLLIGIAIPQLVEKGAVTGAPESPQLEGNISDVTTQEEEGEAEAGMAGEPTTLTHMTEIQIRIDEMLPDGFVGTVEVGTDIFKAGTQISVIAQDNVTVVQKDGSIFAYDELEPNIPESDLSIGNSVWVGFQKYDYVEGNGKYNQIFAYHVVDRNDSTATDIEPMEELSMEAAVADERFGSLFPASILEGYELQDTVAILNDTVLVASFYNKTLEDELTIRIAAQEWFRNQQNDLKLNTVMYREKSSGTESYIYIAGEENIVQYTFSKTDIAENEKFYDMVYTASYFSECIDYPDIDVKE